MSETTTAQYVASYWRELHDLGVPQDLAFELVKDAARQIHEMGIVVKGGAE